MPDPEGLKEMDSGKGGKNIRRRMWRLVAVIAIAVLCLIVGQTAMADSVTLSEDKNESAGTVARWYVKEPDTYFWEPDESYARQLYIK